MGNIGEIDTSVHFRAKIAMNLVRDLMLIIKYFL